MQIYGLNTDELYSDHMTSVNKNVPTKFLEKFSKFMVSLKRKRYLKKNLIGEYHYYLCDDNKNTE